MQSRILTAAVLASLASARAAHADHVNGIYAELLGKAGAYGLGFDHRVHRRVTVGVVASFGIFDSQRVASLMPYVGLYPVRNGAHSWFFDLGPLAVHTWEPSPVPEWDGDSDTGVAFGLSSGYEYRSRFLFRAYVHGVGGAGGIFPWLGIGVGCAF